MSPIVGATIATIAKQAAQALGMSEEEAKRAASESVQSALSAHHSNVDPEAGSSAGPRQKRASPRHCASGHAHLMRRRCCQQRPPLLPTSLVSQVLAKQMAAALPDMGPKMPEEVRHSQLVALTVAPTVAHAQPRATAAVVLQVAGSLGLPSCLVALPTANGFRTASPRHSFVMLAGRAAGR